MWNTTSTKVTILDWKWQLPCDNTIISKVSRSSCLLHGSFTVHPTEQLHYFVNPIASTGINSWNASWMYELLLAA